MHPDAILNDSGRAGVVVKYKPGHHIPRRFYMSADCKVRHPNIVAILESLSALPRSKITHEDNWDTFYARFMKTARSNRRDHTYFIHMVTRREMRQPKHEKLRTLDHSKVLDFYKKIDPTQCGTKIGT